MPSVLVLHGFTSHPVLTMGPLPKALRDAGFEVAQPALRGHGTRPEDLAGVRYQDWLADARAAYRDLAPPRAVVGLSMGGLLAAWLAAEAGAEALVALAPALGFRNPLASLAPYLHWLIPRHAGESSILDPELKKRSPNYPWFPSRAFVELYRLARLTPEKLSRVEASTLVIAAGEDTVVPRAAVRRYFELLGSRDKTFSVLEDSGHDMLLDRHRDEAARRVVAFLQEKLL